MLGVKRSYSPTFTNTCCIGFVGSVVEGGGGSGTLRQFWLLIICWMVSPRKLGVIVDAY